MTLMSFFILLFLICSCYGIAVNVDKLQLPHKQIGGFKSIISFGDSYADTGNYVYYSQDKHPYGYFPYGETYFHHSTGRCSNGRLVIDFIAKALGLSFVPPYLGQNYTHFKQGVNFAVASATAVDALFFAENNIHLDTNFSLGVQVQWFKQLLPSLCGSRQSCGDMLRSSLILMGEIGGNDINFPFFQNKSVQEITPIIKKAVDAISSAITTLIDEGAVTFIVPGNLPIGCYSSYLTKFQSNNKDDYDLSIGCLNWLNELVQFQNNLLQIELNRLRKIYPNANIIYADYYNIVMEMLRFPKKLGFRSGVLQACCGRGGPYNFDFTAFCGSQGTTVCDNPSVYIHWDGIHLTEAAYEYIATEILESSMITYINI